MGLKNCLKRICRLCDRLAKYLLYGYYSDYITPSFPLYTSIPVRPIVYGYKYNYVVKKTSLR